MLPPCSTRRARANVHSTLPSPTDWNATMTQMLRRFRRAVSVLGAEDRPEFKRVDASPAVYDDGSWLTPKS
jgi:hypothetical protein